MTDDGGANEVLSGDAETSAAADDLERAACFDKIFTPKMIGHLRKAARALRVKGMLVEAFRRIPECARALDTQEPNFFNHVDVVFRLGGRDVRREADALFRALHAALAEARKAP